MKVCLKRRRHAELAKAVDRQAQKGLCSGHVVHWNMVTTRTDTGVKHHPKVTKQGTPGTGKPAMALCKKKAAKPYAVAE